MCRKRWEIKSFCVCLGENLERKRESISQKILQNAQNSLLFIFLYSGGIYAEKMTIQLTAKGPPASSNDPLRCAGADMLTLANLSCSLLTSNTHWKAFPDSDWANLGVPRKVWMSSFQKTKENKNPTTESKFMASRSELMCPIQLSRYPNRFNFNFDPWIVLEREFNNLFNGICFNPFW